ncbi:hypothetical protein BKA62DRAFT_773415 [Auriculariales sp. MPI-PUGE-AT-0066]|nr:hypothetical protein BKA62DRAFT_773415 [Auriculariales sp. MPI-PUGE-AT-0066]
MSSSTRKRRGRAELPDISPLKRARIPFFNYLLLDPDYQPIAIGTFALADLKHSTITSVEERLSTKHAVSVQSVYVVEEAH